MKIPKTYRELYTEYTMIRTTYLDGKKHGYPEAEQLARWERLKELDKILSDFEARANEPERAKKLAVIIGVIALAVLLSLIMLNIA